MAKYYALTNVQIKAMKMLGLSRQQVLVPNFGNHTIDAIQAETTREEGALSLEEAFAKYRELTWWQINEMKMLGLSRQQVTVPNTDAAFEMDQGPSYIESKEFTGLTLERI